MPPQQSPAHRGASAFEVLVLTDRADDLDSLFQIIEAEGISCLAGPALEELLDGNRTRPPDGACLANPGLARQGQHHPNVGELHLRSSALLRGLRVAPLPLKRKIGWARTAKCQQVVAEGRPKRLGSAGDD